MTPEQKIPDEIKKQIETYCRFISDENSRTLTKVGCEFGYSLGIAARSAGLERAKELEEVLKLAVKKYADEMTNPFCMEWYKQATKLLNK